MTLQCDEVWAYVGKKTVKRWIWLALDAHTRLIVGGAIGSRDRATADELWDNLPPAYRQRAVCYTDGLAAYAKALPSKRHRSVVKGSGQTNLIERFNCTLRQRCARLVRKTLSFSKKLDNLIGAVWLFIHHYNAHRLSALNTT